MEPQPYAAKMQTDMISEIESSQPEYLVWIASPDSWNVRPNSDRTIFDWFSKYSESHYEKIGVVDTHSTDQTIFFWDENVKDYHGEPDLSVYRKK